MADHHLPAEVAGWEARAPSAAVARIDRTLAPTTGCPCCGAARRRYVPLTEPATDAYRAFAVCGDCGHHTEF